MKSNFIFTPEKFDSYPIHTNACVGNNGNSDIFEYAKGFASAANILIKISTTQDSSFGNLFHPDYAVYPICFNMRHSIELFLKSYIKFTIHLAELKKIKINHSAAMMKAHDINNLWDYLTNNYKILDKRLINKANVIAPYIECFGNIDATGQTFRYPYDIENKKHLISQSVINIMHLGRHFNELEQLLESFYNYHHSIIFEYEMGSFTRNLSRDDLLAIAKMLPHINEWKNNSFKKLKNEIIAIFNISSNELTNAINIIKNHYEFGYFIGKVPLLSDFNEEEFYFFMDKWYQLHDLSYIYNKSDDLIIDSNNIDSSIDENNKRSFKKRVIRGTNKSYEIAKTTDELINYIEAKTVININTLYYFSRECVFSEEYSLTYPYYERDCKQDIKQAIRHILNKTILLPEIIISLLRLNQNQIALTLIDKYKLKNYIKEQLEQRDINISISFD
ncbi:hypothetical protein [Gilliamella sp. G0441]|uniref:hypothetical protein n=1 Tax=Gilliamella sp. G0441 TaxID=3384760 RepID=UPI003D351EE5